MLGGGVREHPRRVRHDDPACADRVEVDVVETDGVVGDDAQLGPRRVEERLVHGNRGRGDDSVGSMRSVDELERGCELLLDLGGDPGRLVHPRARHG
jgi:hypothetical protein